MHHSHRTDIPALFSFIFYWLETAFSQQTVQGQDNQAVWIAADNSLKNLLLPLSFKLFVCSQETYGKFSTFFPLHIVKPFTYLMLYIFYFTHVICVCHYPSSLLSLDSLIWLSLPGHVLIFGLVSMWLLVPGWIYVLPSGSSALTQIKLPRYI
jgi:hypothetical protein